MNLISNKDLYDLIKSLTKSEKRFLKLYATASHLEKSLIELFELIEKKDNYGDLFTDGSKQEVKANTKLNNQHAEQLYEFILQCLRSFHVESNASFIIKDEITNILNLFDKAQYKQCRKILNKQKLEAYKYERFHFILELISLEKLLINIETQFNIKHSSIEEIAIEENEVIKKAKNLGEYTLLFSKINMLSRTSESAKTNKDFEDLDIFLNSSLLKNKENTDSIKSLIIYHNCRVLLFQKKLDNESRQKECEQVISVFEKNESVIEEMPKHYLFAINNLMIIAYQSQAYKTCAKHITKMRSVKTHNAFNTTDLQLKIFTSSYNAEISTYIDSAKFDEAKILVTEIEEGLKEFEGKINKEEVLKFYYNFALMYTYDADYIKAKEYIGKVLNNGDSLLRMDLQSFARILNIVISYELNDKAHLEYIINAVKIYYQNQKSLYKAEKHILQFFDKLTQIKNLDITKEKALFMVFQTELTEILKDPLEQGVMFYFEIATYIESKIKNVSMASLMAKKYTKAWLN